jgi:hypothetical protein
MNGWFCILTALAGLALAQDKQPGSPPSAPGNPASIELTVYLVSGLAQPQAADKDEIPQDLASTLQQLRGVFAYKSYKLIDAVTLRGRNNRGSEVAGRLPDGKFYDFKYIRARISDEKPHLVHLDSLILEIKVTNPNKDYPIALVSTDLDVREGQKTVVGKSTVDAMNALFMVIVPKVIE